MGCRQILHWNTSIQDRSIIYVDLAIDLQRSFNDDIACLKHFHAKLLKFIQTIYDYVDGVMLKKQTRR
jgi:hypothetical protein